MSEDSHTNNKIHLVDKWNTVFDKSLATPVRDGLCRKGSSNLILEEIDEEVTDEIIVPGGHTFRERAVTPQYQASIPRRVRESQENKRVPQNVRPEKKEKKEEKQLQQHIVAVMQPLRPFSREKSKEKIPIEFPSSESKKSLVTQRSGKEKRNIIHRPVVTVDLPKASVPGGQPITLQTARSLRLLVFGSTFTSFNTDFRSQHINFYRNYSYALSFYKSGPDGVMVCLQAFLLKYLLYEQTSSGDKTNAASLLQPLSPDRQKALVSAISHMVWQAGGHSEGVIVLPCGQCDWSYLEHYREDYLTEKFRLCSLSRDAVNIINLHLFKFKRRDELEYFVKKHLPFFENTSGNGCILILYSVMLSRSLSRVQDDLGEDSATLMGPHDTCTQAMINLMLTGRATSHVFNGCVEYDTKGRLLAYPMKGVKSRSEIGFLTIQEHYSPDVVTVGSMLKTPTYPIWVVNTGERYGVLFSLNKALLNDWKHERLMELYYYNGYTSHNTIADGILMVVDTRYEFNPDEKPDGTPPIENCIRTKWAGAVIERKNFVQV